MLFWTKLLKLLIVVLMLLSMLLFLVTKIPLNISFLNWMNKTEKNSSGKRKAYMCKTLFFSYCSFIDWRRFKARRRSVLLLRMLSDSSKLLMLKRKTPKVNSEKSDKVRSSFTYNLFLCSTITSSCTWNWSTWLVGSWGWGYYFLDINWTWTKKKI